jgi:SAM-dependent methyltransferase
MIKKGWAMGDTDCNEIFFAEFAKSVREDAVVIDIGCGSNKHINLVSKKIGIGIDEQLQSGVQNTNFVIANVEKIPLRNECSDVVIAHWVLEHLQNPTNTANEVYRILGNSGVFIFVTPYRYYFASLAAWIVPWNHLKSWLVGFRVYTTHYGCNTLNTLRKTLGSAGFREVKLVKTYEPTWLRFRLFNLLLWPLNCAYRSGIKSLLPPHHLVGVFIKKEGVAR